MNEETQSLVTQATDLFETAARYFNRGMLIIIGVLLAVGVTTGLCIHGISVGGIALIAFIVMLLLAIIYALGALAGLLSVILATEGRPVVWAFENMLVYAMKYMTSGTATADDSTDSDVAPAPTPPTVDIEALKTSYLGSYSMERPSSRFVVASGLKFVGVAWLLLLSANLAFPTYFGFTGAVTLSDIATWKQLAAVSVTYAYSAVDYVSFGGLKALSALGWVDSLNHAVGFELINEAPSKTLGTGFFYWVVQVIIELSLISMAVDGIKSGLRDLAWTTFLKHRA